MSIDWILISDAARGRLFETSKAHGKWTELACYTNPDLRGTPQQRGTRRSAPRAYESVGRIRHVIEPHTSHKGKNTSAFASLIATDILEGRLRRRYKRLFLIAPPHFLGVLRDQLGDPETAGIAGTLASDVVALPTQELIQHIRQAFPRKFATYRREMA
jgi:protein required for attachment to host cells